MSQIWRADDLAERLPRLVGWKGTQHPFDFDARTLPLASTARRFELSTMSYASTVGLETSIAFLSSVGIGRIDEHTRRLAERLVANVEDSGWHPYRPCAIRRRRRTSCRYATPPTTPAS